MKEIDIGAESEVKILAGSHNKIIIEKLYGPTVAGDLLIEWGEDGWEVKQEIIPSNEEKKEARVENNYMAQFRK